MKKLSICIFSTSIEPIWFDSEKIETKRNGIKTLPRLNFLPSLGKFFVDFFWLFPCFWTFFCVFQLFSKKDETKWNTYQCLDITEPRDNTYTDTHKFSEPRNEISQVLKKYSLFVKTVLVIFGQLFIDIGCFLYKYLFIFIFQCSW